MFQFSKKSAIKVDDLLIFDQDKIQAYIKKNQILFEDLVLEHSPSKHTAYGYNTLGHMVKISYDGEQVQKIVLVKKKPKQKRIKMIITYDGSNFHGFQTQLKQRTVQGELSKVISNIEGKDILVQGASRTDALVHARMQVVHFDTDLAFNPDKWMDIVNHQCPKDIHVLNAETVHPLFHSRYDVFQKTYVYQIHMGGYDPLLANYYHFIKSLDLQAMKDALEEIKGTHDFSSFSKVQEGDLVRTIYETNVEKVDDVLMIKMTGNGFLRYMVRLIVDYLIKIGKHQTRHSISEILEMKSRQFTNNIAPAEGLYLERVVY